MKKSRLVFYVLLFLTGFAPFLPVPYSPNFLHEFFSGIFGFEDATHDNLFDTINKLLSSGLSKV